MTLVDTHCHIHDSTYPLDREKVYARARAADIAMICVGTSQQSSREAVEFAATHNDVYAAIGVHPHEAKDGWEEVVALADSTATTLLTPKHASVRRDFPDTVSLSSAELALLRQSSTSKEAASEKFGDISTVSLPGDEVTVAGEAVESAEPAMDASSHSPALTYRHLQPETDKASGPLFGPGAKPFVSEGGRGRSGEQNKGSKLVAIGEIGLDYFSTHSPRDIQIVALEAQIELALKHNLPIIFHVRGAFADFWPIFDNFPGIRGVLHSFTDTQTTVERALARGLYIGVNGISTFTKDPAQREMFAAVPLERMLLETDAPFLTPAPLRGTINEPMYVEYVAGYHATARGLSVSEIAAATTANANTLFALS